MLFFFVFCGIMKGAFMKLGAPRKNISSATEPALYYSLVRLIKKRSDGLSLLRNKTVTGKSYKKMRWYYAYPRTREYLETTMFQPNGAFSHYAVTVRQNLNINVPNC